MPEHEDRVGSLSVESVDGRAVVRCLGGCATSRVLAVLELSESDLLPAVERARRAPPPKAAVAEQPADAQPVAQVLPLGAQSRSSVEPRPAAAPSGVSPDRRRANRSTARDPVDSFAERELVGVLLDPRTLPDVRAGALDIAGRADFLDPGLGEIRDAIATCETDVTLSSVSEVLQARGALERIGDVAALSELLDELVGAPDVEALARRVRRHALEREERRIAEEVAKDGGDVHLRGRWVEIQEELEALARPGGQRSGARPVLVELGSVEPRAIVPLWPGRIYRGTITLLDGDPDLGKSTVALDLAARISVGRGMPDGAPGTLGDVIVCSYEDLLAETIRPRLDAAGADLSRVHALRVQTAGEEPEGLSLPGDLGALEEAISAKSAVLLIIDPLMAAISGEIDTHRDQDVRRVLSRLTGIAERTGAAVLVVRHLNKNMGAANPLYRGGGSIGIIGAARSGLMVAPDPRDPARRVLARTKCNLAAPVPSLGYRLVPANGTVAVDWLGVSGHSANELLAAPASPEERGRQDEAEDVLRELLSGGARPASEVKAEARRAGVSDRTLDRAKAALGVHAQKGGLRDGWYWTLPDRGPKDAKDATGFPYPQNSGVLRDDGALRDGTGTCAGDQGGSGPKGANGPGWRSSSDDGAQAVSLPGCEPEGGAL